MPANRLSRPSSWYWKLPAKGDGRLQLRAGKREQPLGGFALLADGADVGPDVHGRLQRGRRRELRHFVQRACELQRFVLRQREHRPQRLVRHLGGAARANLLGSRVGEFHLRAQDVEPRRRSRAEPRLRQLEVALGDFDAFGADAYTLFGHQRRVERLVDPQRQRLLRALDVEPAGFLRCRLRAVRVVEPPAGVERLRDVEPDDVLANQVRAERLLVRAEDARGNLEQRRGLCRRVEEVQVQRRQERRARLGGGGLALAQPFLVHLESFVARLSRSRAPGRW